VFIEDFLDLVATLDDVGGFLVTREFEVDVLPNAEHFLQHVLDVELFLGTFSDLATHLAVFQQVHVQNVLETELVPSGFHHKVDLVGDLLPMTFLHTFLPQGDHQRHLGAELIQLHLDDVRDLAHGLDVPVLEVPQHSTQSLDRVFDELLRVSSLQLSERTVEPLGVVSEPLVGCQPQVGVGLEVFDHGVQLGVVGLLIHLEETFLHVELPGVFLISLQLLVDTHDVLGNVLMVLELLVLVEVLDGSFEVVDGGLELFLLVLHLVQELDLVLVQSLLALFHEVVGFLGTRDDQPLLVHFFLGEAVVEGLQDAVDVGGFRNFLLNF